MEGKPHEPTGVTGLSRTVEVWLKTEHLSREERLDRLAADAELYRELQRANFQGPDWDFFINELARYGLAVMRGWIRRGLIVAKCREKGFSASDLPASVSADPQAIRSLADETVAEALWRFRDEVLVPGVWDPARGASLRTFFIGQCLKRYGNVARAFLRHEVPVVGTAPIEELLKDEPAPMRVDTHAIRTMTAQALLHGASSDRAARILALDAAQYRNGEIAQMMDMTVDAVSSVLKRERARLKARWEDKEKP